MSVLIRSMEMPKDCRECPLMEYHEQTGKTWCKPVDGILADDYKSIAFDGRHKWCPLVELPKKHGRLIDKDKAIDFLNKSAVKVITEKDVMLAEKIGFTTGFIAQEPVVLEAEGAKE